MAVALVLFSAVALQAQGLQQKVEFVIDGKIGNELVKKGNYTISFPDADSGNLEIKIGKKVVTAPFTRQPLEIVAVDDKMSYRDNADGSRSIASITLRGRKYTLVLQ
jgi:hypothetical protein